MIMGDNTINDIMVSCEDFESHIKRVSNGSDIGILPVHHFSTYGSVDNAKREYERVYSIMGDIYAKTDSIELVLNIYTQYFNLYEAVREYNDIEYRKILADDTSNLKNFLATLSRAEKINITWDETDGVNYRILEIRAIDKSNNSDSIAWDNGINELLLNDVVKEFDRTYSRLTKKHPRWSQCRNIIADAIRGRLFYDTDIRTASKTIAIKCRELYRLLLEYYEKQNGRHLPSDDAVNMTIRILGLKMDVGYIDRFKRLIQGEK